MIEFVTIGIHATTFSAHYIGARSIEDGVYRRKQADVQALPDFVQLLTDNGFTEFNRSDSVGLVSYMREGNMLEGDSDGE